jgi:hypothetical protein
VAGPGSDCSEVSAVGIGPAALDCRVAPRCPPGPVAIDLASLTIRWKPMSVRLIKRCLRALAILAL